MGTAISQLVPIALGVALSPVGIAELLLILLSKRAATNGLVFVGGASVLLVAVPLVAAVALDLSAQETTTAPSTLKSWIFVILGPALLVLAWRRFQGRHDATMPAVFDTIGRMGPGAVLVLVPGVTVANPKNLALMLSAGSVAEAHDLGGVALVVVILVFAVIAASPFVVATGYLLLRGDSATRTLETSKEWVMRHNAAITAVILVVLGVYLLTEGVGALLA